MREKPSRIIVQIVKDNETKYHNGVIGTRATHTDQTRSAQKMRPPKTWFDKKDTNEKYTYILLSSTNGSVVTTSKELMEACKSLDGVRNSDENLKRIFDHLQR